MNIGCACESVAGGMRSKVGNRRLQSHGTCLQVTHARDKPYLPQTLQGTHGSQTILPSPHHCLILLPCPGHDAQASLMCSAVDELEDIISLSIGQPVDFPAGFPPSEVTLGCCRWSCVHLSFLSREEAQAELICLSHLICFISS